MKEGHHGFKEAIKSRNDNQEAMRQLDTSGLIFPQMIDEGKLYIDKTLLDDDAETLRENLEEILSSESYFDLQDERDYQQILLTVLTLIRGDYEVVAQRESGAGRSDILMVSDNRPSIIFELKRSRGEDDLEKDAERALKQIHDRKYYAGLKGDVILYGISFWSKFPCVRSEIVTIERD